jgi:hypothetical protein
MKTVALKTTAAKRVGCPYRGRGLINNFVTLNPPHLKFLSLQV